MLLAKRIGEATVSSFCGDVSIETAIEKKARNIAIDINKASLLATG